jgi:nitroimidazol reductase NimA-like FMN-containing flavoprotein (pyridoxamine 5'-phosphate oxidase superfamily)
MSQSREVSNAAAPVGAKTGAATAPSKRTRVRRLAENARYDAATIRRIVDAAWVCHIAFVDEQGAVHCIPTACWREADHVYVHGSNGSRLLKALQAPRDAVLTITHFDGLVLARSAFNHSMNYRSVVIYGRFETVADADKPAALAAFMERIAPGRQAQARPGNAKELAATTVLRLSLAEASAKVHAAAPEDDPEDLDRPVWAGVLPVELRPGAPQPDGACDPAAVADPPAHVRDWPNRSFAAT